jgi:hypothetical protein
MRYRPYLHRRTTLWLLLGMVLVPLCAIAAWMDARAFKGRSAEARSQGGANAFIPRSFGSAGVSRSEVSAATVQFLATPVNSIGARMHRWRAAVCAGPPVAGKQIALKEMSAVFSESEFRRAFPKSPSLVFKRGSGWQVHQESNDSTRANWAAESHVDQFLATCAETGIPLTQAIEVTGEKATVDKDTGEKVTVETLLESSRANFVAGQDPCWSLVAYCVYRPDESVWQDRFGDSHSYESIAISLMEEPIDQDPCAGGHRHYALAILLQADEHNAILSTGARRKIEAFLQKSSRLLERSQSRSGSWGRGWAHPDDANARDSRDAESTDLLLLVTAHHLEWAAITDPRHRPSDEALAAACQFVLQAIQGRSRTNAAAYCGWSHAIRSLWLFDRGSN